MLTTKVSIKSTEKFIISFNTINIQMLKFLLVNVFLIG